MSYINDALLSTNHHKKLKDDSKHLVEKWDKTGLLEGLDGEYNKSGMAILLENQARQLIDEVNTTSPAGAGTANQEEWSGVALPLVRRIFAEIAAQDFVSVQPMNLPSGLVFYMDFQYGKAHSGRNKGDSIYGKTGPKSPFNGDSGAENTGTFPRGGFYGAGQYGYTQPTSSAFLTGGSTGVAAATLADLDYDTEFSSSYAGKLFKVTITDGGTLISGSRDLTTIRSWAFTSGSNVGATSYGILDGDEGDNNVVAKRFTKHSTTTDDITFVVNSDNNTTSLLADGWTAKYFVQPTAADRGDFEDSNGGGLAEGASALQIPEVDLQLKSSTIVAKTRKLKAVWTPELAQDLNAYHSIDAEAELTAMLSEYISMEIDLEILDMLMNDAVTVDYWSAKVGFEYDTSTSDFRADVHATNALAYTKGEWYTTLGQKIQKISNKIHQLTLRGGANFVVCSPSVATIIESIPGFAGSTDGTNANFAMGVRQIGSLSNRWTVYKNPYMTENQVLVGFRGSNFLETGAVYAPYVPLIMTPLVYDPDNFTPRKGVMTRYAKKMVRPEYYAKLLIHGLETI
jgi:hypothetical protein